MPENQNTNPLASIVRQSGLEQSKAEIVLAQFQDYFKIAADWEAKAKTIVVTSPEQVDLMKDAREGRLLLKGKRVAIETARKTLKEQSLREGKAIDGIASTLKALIEPIEGYLEKQEKFVEIQDAKRVKELTSARASEILRFGGNPNLFNLGAMSDTDFQSTLSGVRLAEEKRIEEEATAALKASEHRLEMEQLAAENEKLRLEREQFAEREREAVRARMRLEAEEKKRVAAEQLQAKREAEEKRRMETEPDKLKLERWADDLATINPPDVVSDEAVQIEGHVMTKISALIQWLRDQAEEM